MPRRATALQLWRLQAESVAGHLSISNRTFVTCFTARVRLLTFELTRLCYLIAQLHSLLFCLQVSGRPTVNQRACNHPSTLSRTSRVFQSKRILARSERAVALKPRKPFAHRAQACGKAFYNLTTSPKLTERPQRGQSRRKDEAHRCPRIFTTHLHSQLYTSVYISFSTSATLSCVYSACGDMAPSPQESIMLF
jgi:hypothetical protein